MRRLRPIALLALAMLSAPCAMAQWQWLDKDGRKVFSDQAPPPGIPDKNILKRPGQRNAAADPQAAASAAASAPAPAAPAPKVSGKDKDLEQKRKQAQAEEDEKKKAQEEEVARARAENCDRAKKSKATIDSGVRISTTNAKGEREIMDDTARAAEAKRMDAVIARDCKPAGG
jgi:hypothetical protein